MPEQNPLNAAPFNPAAFSLPNENAPKLSYVVVANSDQPTLSAYVQSVFHRTGTPSPGATLTDQAPSGYRSSQGAHSFADQGFYAQSGQPQQPYAAPITSGQQHHYQGTHQYQLTDQVPNSGNGIYRPSNQPLSFAPPTNRSSLQYVPKKRTKPVLRSGGGNSVLDNSQGRTTPGRNNSSYSQPTQPVAEKTNLVDLRTKTQKLVKFRKGELPARDSNTLNNKKTNLSDSAELMGKTGFLKRKAFSSKFTVTPKKTKKAERTQNKIIYLKSTPREKPSAQLKVPQFHQQETAATEKVAPAEKPAPKMLEPITRQPTGPKYTFDFPFTPTQSPTQEVTSTVRVPEPIVPKEVPVETPVVEPPAIETTEPAATAFTPFEATEEPAVIQALPTEKDSGDQLTTVSEANPFKEMAETAPANPFEETALVAPANPFEEAAAVAPASPFEKIGETAPASPFEEVAEVAPASPFEEAAPKPLETEIQPVAPPAEDAEVAEASLFDQGSSKSDFTLFKKTVSVDVPPATSPIRNESLFRVASLPPAKAKHKRQLVQKTNERTITQTSSQDESQIILPKFRFKESTSAKTAPAQLTAMTVQRGQREIQSKHQHEIPWLNPWWMLIGLIPLALYFGTKTLFRDEDDHFAYPDQEHRSSESFVFGSDFGELGGSKSDPHYGPDKTMEEIQSSIKRMTGALNDEASTGPRSSIKIEESLLYEVASTDRLAEAKYAQELSAEHSPNFADTIKFNPNTRQKLGNKKLSKKLSKKRKRQNG